MTNAYYNVSGTPASSSRGKSLPIRVEFSGIAAGFDGAEAALALKAPLASPSFTGTATFALSPTAPTPTPASDNSTKVATTAFVQAAVGASGALLPPQASNNGKVLRTDGTSASWSDETVEIPAQAGNEFKVLTTNGSSVAWQLSGNYLVGSHYQLTADVTLTSASEYFYINCSGVTPGTVIRLPDATTLPNGWVVMIGDADGSNEVGIETSDGDLMSSALTTGALLRLESNATAVGTWRTVDNERASALLTTPAGYIASDSTSLRASKDRSSYVEISSGVYLVCTGAVAGAGVDVFVTSVSGMGISNGAVSTVGTDTVAWITVKAVSGGYVCLYATASGGAVYGFGITVSGTTATAGARTTVLASISGLSLKAESNGTDVLLLAQTTSTVTSAVMVDGSGTGLNVGTTATLFTAGAAMTNIFAAACSLSASVWGIAVASTESGVDKVRLLSASYSGLTLTIGTVTTTTQHADGAVAVVPLTSTSMLMCATREATSASARVTVVSSMTTTPVDNTATDYAHSVALGALGGIELVACGSYYVAVVGGGSGSALIAVTVSGNTVSIAGSATTVSITNSYEGWRPQWDGEYLHFGANNGPAFGLYSVSGAGLAVGPPAGSYTAASGVATSGGHYSFRITGSKKAVLFGADCTARVIRWGENS